MSTMNSFRCRILIAGVLLAALLFFGWRTHRVGSPDASEHRGDGKTESSATDIYKASDRPPSRVVPQDLRRKAAEWHARLVADRPALQVEFRDVPDEENGFLQWLDFIDGFSGDSLVPEDISEMIRTNEKWDAERFGVWLAENRELMERLIALGLLPDCSAAGISPSRILNIDILPLRDFNSLMSAYARYALEQGDTGEAHRALSSLMGTAGHFDGIETPTYLISIVALQMKREAQRFLTDVAFADTGVGVEMLHEWKSMVTGSDTPEWSTMTKGEWNVGTAALLLPHLLGWNDDLNLSSFRAQPELAATASADLAEAMVLRAEQNAWADLLSPMPLPSPIAESVTESMAEELGEGLSSTNRLAQAWTADKIRDALLEAALALAFGEEPPVEPVTGKPFVVDEITGTVKLPEDPVFAPIEVEPRKIPALRE